VGRVVGDVELDGKVLVIRRIHVRLELKVKPEDADTARRVHGFYAESCPLYRTLRTAITITTELILV
jgi:uncharacterized OsmC-like protein